MARVSRFGLSTKQATEPHSDNLLNRTRNLSEPYFDKEILLRRTLRRFAFLVGLSTGNPPKIGTFPAWNRTRNRTRTPSETNPVLLLLTIFLKTSKKDRATPKGALRKDSFVAKCLEVTIGRPLTRAELKVTDLR